MFCALVLASVLVRHVRQQPVAALASYVSSLQKAKEAAGPSYQRYLRDATLITEQTLEDCEWSAAKKVLSAESIKIEDSPTGDGTVIENLDIPGTALSVDGFTFDLNVSLVVDAKPSQTQPSKMMIRDLFVSLVANPDSNFATDSVSSANKDTVLGKILLRPAVISAAKQYPIIDTIRLEYHPHYESMDIYESGPPAPYVFDITLSLARGPKWHRSGIELNYFAESDLDSPLQGDKPIDPHHLPKDVISDLQLPEGTTEGEFPKDRYAKFIPQYMIARVGFDWPDDDKMAAVYGRGDIVSLSVDTKAIKLFGDQFRANNLSSITRFHNLQSLDLTEVEPFTWAGAEDFLFIKQLRNLRDLRLPIADMPVSAAVIKGISMLPHLERLEIYNSRLTASESRLVCGIPTLKYLRLSFCKGLGDDGIALLSRNKKLGTLILQGTAGYSAPAFMRLATLSELRDLDVGPLPKSFDHAVESVVKKSPLEDLSFDTCHISAVLVQVIASKTELRSLAFSSCSGLSDRSIQALVSLKHPDTVDFDGCPGVSEEAVKSLMNRLKGKYEIL